MPTSFWDVNFGTIYWMFTKWHQAGICGDCPTKTWSGWPGWTNSTGIRNRPLNTWFCLGIGHSTENPRIHYNVLSIVTVVFVLTYLMLALLHLPFWSWCWLNPGFHHELHPLDWSNMCYLGTWDHRLIRWWTPVTTSQKRGKLTSTVPPFINFDLQLEFVAIRKNVQLQLVVSDFQIAWVTFLYI